MIFSSVESGKVKRSAGKIQLALHCSAIAQLLVCLRNVKMSTDYKQPNFVVSKMNQKEAKTLSCSQISYNLKSFPLQILSSFYKTQQFFSPQVILLSLSIYFIYLARETLKEGICLCFYETCKFLL